MHKQIKKCTPYLITLLNTLPALSSDIQRLSIQTATHYNYNKNSPCQPAKALPKVFKFNVKRQYWPKSIGQSCQPLRHQIPAARRTSLAPRASPPPVASGSAGFLVTHYPIASCGPTGIIVDTKLIGNALLVLLFVSRLQWASEENVSVDRIRNRCKSCIFFSLHN